jgi:hypothetical protein
VALHKRGRFWHYEFQVNGTRYRGSTKQTTQTRARQIEVRKMQEAQENGYSALPKKAPILRDFAAAVLKSFDNSSLDPDTKRYYRNGWSRIETTPLANMKLDRINGTRLQPMRSKLRAMWLRLRMRWDTRI